MSRFLLRCAQVVHVYFMFALRYMLALNLFHVFSSFFTLFSCLFQVYIKFISSLFQVCFKFSGCVSRLSSMSRFIHVFLYVYFTIFVRCFSRFFRVDDF